MEKCSDYVLAYLAILKAGGAYMPLDLAHPPELLKKIVDEAKPNIVVRAPGRGVWTGEVGGGKTGVAGYRKGTAGMSISAR